MVNEGILYHKDQSSDSKFTPRKIAVKISNIDESFYHKCIDNIINELEILKICTREIDRVDAKMKRYSENTEKIK